jgi:hypothetical protein
LCAAIATRRVKKRALSPARDIVCTNPSQQSRIVGTFYHLLFILQDSQMAGVFGVWHYVAPPPNSSWPFGRADEILPHCRHVEIVHTPKTSGISLMADLVSMNASFCYTETNCYFGGLANHSVPTRQRCGCLTCNAGWKRKEFIGVHERQFGGAGRANPTTLYLAMLREPSSWFQSSLLEACSNPPPWRNRSLDECVSGNFTNWFRPGVPWQERPLVNWYNTPDYQSRMIDGIFGAPNYVVCVMNKRHLLRRVLATVMRRPFYSMSWLNKKSAKAYHLKALNWSDYKHLYKKDATLYAQLKATPTGCFARLAPRWKRLWPLKPLLGSAFRNVTPASVTASQAQSHQATSTHPLSSHGKLAAVASTPSAESARQSRDAMALAALQHQRSSQRLHDGNHVFRLMWGSHPWKLRATHGQKNCWDLERTSPYRSQPYSVFFQDALDGRHCRSTNWFEGTPGPLGRVSLNTSQLPSGLIPVFGFDEAITRLCQIRASPKWSRWTEAGHLPQDYMLGRLHLCLDARLSILYIFSRRMRYNLCRNLEWLICAVRGLLPSQHGPTFYLARNLLANKTDDLTCGYRAGSYSSGDSYHLEIGLLGYICSNGDELFRVLQTGKDALWTCQLSEARVRELPNLLLPPPTRRSRAICGDETSKSKPASSPNGSSTVNPAFLNNVNLQGADLMAVRDVNTPAVPGCMQPSARVQGVYVHRRRPC